MRWKIALLFVFLVSISPLLAAPGNIIVREREFTDAGFEIKVSHPSRAAPGERLRLTLTIITNRTLRFLVNLTVLGAYPPGEYVIDYPIPFSPKLIKAGGKATFNANFTVPASIASGPLLFLVEVHFSSNSDYEVVNDTPSWASRVALIIGPYVKGVEYRELENKVKSLENDYQQLMKGAEKLKSEVKELNAKIKKLYDEIARLKYYLYLWKEEYRELLKEYLSLKLKIASGGKS